MKTLMVATLSSLLLLGWSVSSSANNQNDMVSMLKQLDQLDQADFDDAIKAIYDCSDRKDFECSDKKIAIAKSLVSDPKDKSSLKVAKQYRQKAYEVAKAEEEQLALEKRQQSCSSQCPIAGEYRRCMADRLSPRHCSSRSDTAYTPMSKLDLVGSALQQLDRLAKDYFQQKQRMLQQQQAIYAQQRQQKQRQQQLIAQQKRDWERAKAHQKRDNRQREVELAALRKEQQRMRRKAAENRQRLNQPQLPKPNKTSVSPGNQKIVRSSGSATKPSLTGEMLVWQNEAKKWWGCGPIQCVWAAEDTEQDVIGYLINENRMTYSYNGPVGNCKSYKVTGLESYDMSSEKVRNLAKCF